MRSAGGARAFALGLGLGAWLCGAPSGALAETLRVGPGETYATPCEAIAAAAEGDEVVVAAGTYTDSCAIDVPGLLLRGEDERPTIDLSGTDHPAQYKGIYVVTADGVTIEKLELTGAHISADNGENAAGIRVEAADLTVRGCFIHDNQNGILGGTTGDITIEHSEFFRNGMGDGCNGGGCTHNLYIADIDALYFRFNWTHGIATDTQDKGHLLKSRAKANYIEYNRITGEDGADSYEIDLPNGGFASILGNVIQKGAASGNSITFAWGEEGITHPDTNVTVAYNTFVNDSDNGTFISIEGATPSIFNNLFVGPGTLSSTGELGPDNLSGIDPLFVDRAGHDYHLREGSPAIDEAVENAVVPEYEYVHPLGSMPRPSAMDVGAFEYGTEAVSIDGGLAGGNGGSGTGGAPSDDGGVSGAGGSGAMAGKGSGGSGGSSASAGKGGSAIAGEGSERADAGTNDAGSDDEAMANEASDCSCSVPGAQRQAASPWLLWGVLGIALLRLKSTIT